jgi:hypothetical protein
MECFKIIVKTLEVTISKRSLKEIKGKSVDWINLEDGRN